MKFRLISDLHLDINIDYPLEYPENTEEVFTVIAGDTSGRPEEIKGFLENHPYIKEGILISGNHIVYNREDKDIKGLQEELKEFFPLESKISYLENNYKIINDIVFIGATLWTDYAYDYYNDSQGMNMHKAERYMNDYRWGLWKKENGENTYLKPEHCYSMHKESLSYIDSISKQYPDKKLVIITHHCPSPKCISKQYVRSEVNGAYVSNLEQFIIDRPNIKVWCCGHVHHSNELEIGNCKVISNPRGYQFRRENPEFNFNKIIEI